MLQLFKHIKHIFTPSTKGDFIGKRIADAIIERLSWIKIEPATILGMGNVNNYVTYSLKKHYKNAIVLNNKQLNEIDAASVDLIFVNLSLLKIRDLLPFFLEIKRILKPQGLFIFSSLGPDTGKELALEHAGLNFMDMHNIGDLLTQAGLESPVMETDYWIVKYKNPKKLKAEYMSATRINIDNNLLPTDSQITYEVVMGHVWQPLLFKQPSGGRAETTISVDKILNKKKK